MSPRGSKKQRSARKDTRTASKDVASSPAGPPPSVTLSRPAVPQGSSSTPRQPVPSQPKPPARARPLLGQRQMADLLRGNRDNRVTVRIQNESVCTILRPIAKHFSRTWRRALANIHCRTVDVALPSAHAQAALADTSTTPINNAQPPTPENLAPTPADKNAVTFIVQWMVTGGADPTGRHALLYPRGNEPELKRLRDLVTALEIDPLIARTNRDIASIRPKYCTLCKTTGHLRRTCVFCIYCKERTHMRNDCPRLRAKNEREWAKAERDGRREFYRAQQEEREQRSLERGIRTGRVAVGNDGKTIWL